jgi:23S rRNA (guanosine2251-2'-O)-methyltransferase
MMAELLYGRRPVYEALRAGRRRVHKLVLAQGLADKAGIIDDIVSLARRSSVPITTSPRRELERLTSHHQGVVAEADPYPFVDLTDILAVTAKSDVTALVLLLDLLQDPQNFGSLLRTAEAAGVHGVCIPKRRAVGVTPAVVSASAGAVEHLRVAQITNLARTIETLKEHDIWVAGLEATPEATAYDKTDLRGPLALVVGSEGSGLRRLVREKCDFLVQLPMYGRVASLNAAVAGSIALYEVLRQRRASPAG